MEAQCKDGVRDDGVASLIVAARERRGSLGPLSLSLSLLCVGLPKKLAHKMEGTRTLFTQTTPLIEAR